MKKLILWIGSRVPRELGPTSRSATPLASTTTVETTTQYRRRRALAAIARIAGVVTNEAVAGAAQFQDDRTDQQHSHEQVDREQRPQRDDRHADHGQQRDQNGAGRGGEALVAARPAAGQASGAPASG